MKSECDNNMCEKIKQSVMRMTVSDMDRLTCIKLSLCQQVEVICLGTAPCIVNHFRVKQRSYILFQ